MRNDLQIAVHEHVERVSDDAFGGILDWHHAVIGAVFGDLGVGLVIAVSRDDGTVLWSYDAKSAVRSSPAIVGGVVLVGDAAGDLFAFKPS